MISVYLDDGRVFEYDVSSSSSVREHAAAIVKDGYRHCVNGLFEHYPPHRILKVKSTGIETSYPDRVRGT
jgi:hypothetical protein